MGIKAHVVYAHHKLFHVGMLYGQYMYNYVKLVHFLAGFLFPTTNHNLLFALELAEAWYE